MSKLSRDEFDWQPFIGRALAFTCLHLADMRSTTLLEQAQFLMQMGLPRHEAAVVLGSTDESLRVLAQRKARGPSGKQGKE